MSNWSDTADKQWDDAKVLLDEIIERAAKAYVILEDQNYHTPNKVTETIAEAAIRLREYMDLKWTKDHSGKAEHEALTQPRDLWNEDSVFRQINDRLHEEGYLDE